MFIQNLFKCLFLCFLLPAASVLADAPLHRIAHVRALSPAEASQGRTAEVEGQILWQHPKQFGAFIFDGKMGLFVSTPELSPLWDSCQLGDRVRVHGVTVAGGYNSGVAAQSLEVLSHDSLPKPRPFWQEEIQLSMVDCDWVMARGRLISAKEIPEYRSIMLVLEIKGYKVDVQLIDSLGAFDQVCELLQEEVQFPAVAGVLFNTQRQMTGRVFYVSSVDDIAPVITRNAGLSAQVCAIPDLQRGSFDYRQMVKTRGVVTYADGGDTFLRGDGASLKMRMQNSDHIHVGDYVEAEGYVWPQRTSPALRARSIEVLDRVEVPRPVRMDLTAPLRSEMNYELVQLDVQLVDIGKAFGQVDKGLVSLLCRAGSYSFEARLPRGTDVNALTPGAKLRLTGICHLTLNPKISYRLDFDGFWLLLQDGAGVEILQLPPWWTATRLIWMLGLVLVVLGIVLLWVILLKKTVEKQTSIIKENVASEMVHQERQRIARELHDSLAQGLAGIALQLKGCLKLVDVSTQARVDWLQKMMAQGNNPDANRVFQEQQDQAQSDDAKTRKSITVIQHTLAYCSAESRNMIFDLRGGLLERMDLPSAMHETLQPLSEECGAELKINVIGKARRLQSAAERSLLLIAKEAITNAARHAAPDHLVVELNYMAQSLQLAVSDDGLGFRANQQPMIGHFGLRGMRERIKKLGGTFTVESAPSAGTSITVELPLLGKWELDQK